MARRGRLSPSHSSLFSLWLPLLQNAERHSRDLLTWQQKRNVWTVWFKPSGNTDRLCNSYRFAVGIWHRSGFLFDCFVGQSIRCNDKWIWLTQMTYLSLSCDSNLTWIRVIYPSKNLRGELEKVRTVKWRSYFGVGFVVVSHREPERVCRTSQSFVVRLLNRLRSVWSVQKKRHGKQSLAICSHFRRSLGFLKSRLAQWNSALPYQKSSLGVASSHLLVYCSIVQPSPPLHLYLSAVRFVAYPPLLTLFLFMWCVCFILQLHPVEASQFMHHSRCLLAAWMREKSVGPAIGRVSLLSDTDTREWSKSQNNGVADCSQTSVCIKLP